MSSGPSVLSKTQARWKGACISLANNVDKVLKTFSTGIDDIAAKHGQCVHFISAYCTI